MNLGDVERQLRAGPPEESEYRVRELVLEGEGIPATAVASVAVGVRASGSTRRALRLGGSIAVVALLVATFAAGRATSGDGQPIGASGQAGASSVARIEPAYVSDALRRAFYSGTDRATSWLACSSADALTCADVAVFAASDFLGDDEWGQLRPATLPAGHLFVGIHSNPDRAVDAYVAPALSPGLTEPLVAVIVGVGDSFLDLGPLRPGRYVVTVIIDPSSPMATGIQTIGIEVS
jgi:hypothetical protein